MTTNGYIRLSNGFIIQWGTTSALANNITISVTLPTAFPSVFLGAVANMVGTFVTNSTDTSILTVPYSLSTLKLSKGVGGGGFVHNLPVFWIALGY